MIILMSASDPLLLAQGVRHTSNHLVYYLYRTVLI